MGPQGLRGQKVGVKPTLGSPAEEWELKSKYEICECHLLARVNNNKEGICANSKSDKNTYAPSNEHLGALAG